MSTSTFWVAKFHFQLLNSSHKNGFVSQLQKVHLEKTGLEKQKENHKGCSQ